MTTDRTSFQSNKATSAEAFKPLVTTKTPARKVESPTANNFNNNALDKIQPTEQQVSKLKKNDATVPPQSNKKRGRPVEITDFRYKVNRPKMISSALEVKLDTLKDYVAEFQTETGRITFEKYLTTLVDSYITEKLSYSKQDSFQSEFEKALENLLK